MFEFEIFMMNVGLCKLLTEPIILCQVIQNLNIYLRKPYIYNIIFYRGGLELSKRT